MANADEPVANMLLSEEVQSQHDFQHGALHNMIKMIALSNGLTGVCGYVWAGAVEAKLIVIWVVSVRSFVKSVLQINEKLVSVGHQPFRVDLLQEMVDAVV